ncbi:hypothetical protein ACOSQ2_004245 [Xanthoceras sorbifolium]
MTRCGGMLPTIYIIKFVGLSRNLEPSLRKWNFGSTGKIRDGAKAPSSQEIAGARSSERAPAILKSKGRDLVLRLEMEPFRCGRWSFEGDCERIPDFFFSLSLPQILCDMLHFMLRRACLCTS